MLFCVPFLPICEHLLDVPSLTGISSAELILVNLVAQYVTLPAGQKRRVVDSVFLNLSLDGVSVCGDYRLPFSILAENGEHPLNSGWVDDFRTAASIYPVTLDLSVAS